MPQKSDIRIEFPSRGATYNRPVWGVYEYSTYPRSSVLAGQQRRVFLDSFDTQEQAEAAYPQAKTVIDSGYRAPDLSHLPDGPDLH